MNHLEKTNIQNGNSVMKLEECSTKIYNLASEMHR